MRMKTSIKLARWFDDDSIVDRVPGEVLSNIFLKLPVKSLLLCRSVCKSWHQLLSDPYFVNVHASQNQSQKLLLKSFSDSLLSVDCEETHGTAVMLNFPLKSPTASPIHIFCSCNGFVCLSFAPRSSGFRVKLVLWNPTTGDYKMLPDVESSRNDLSEVIGFGYDSSAKDYKLVRIVTFHSEKGGVDRVGGHRVHLYSLKTNSWKRIREVPHCNVLFSDCFHGVWAPNGSSIYWAAFQELYRKSKIIAFDLKKEEFREVLLPDESKQDGYWRKCVTVLGGSLCVYYFEGHPKIKVSVWMMNEDEEEDKKEKWNKLMTITSIGYIWEPTCFLEGGKVLLQELLLDSSFAIYDLKEKRIISKYPIHRINNSSNGSVKYPVHGINNGYKLWVKYTQTLLSLNSSNSHQAKQRPPKGTTTRSRTYNKKQQQQQP